MILETLSNSDFSISYESEKEQYTLLKKVGHTWHRLILLEADVQAIKELMKIKEEKLG